jgi:hypothetical protein
MAAFIRTDTPAVSEAASSCIICIILIEFKNSNADAFGERTKQVYLRAEILRSVTLDGMILLCKRDKGLGACCS